MQFARLVKGIPEQVYIIVKNDNAATIVRGTPVYFVMDGTDDGLAVDNPSVGGATKATSFFAGLIPRDLPSGEEGLSQVYGMVDALLLTRQTRAASTDSYASAASVGVGNRLNVETVGNGMSVSDAGVASVTLPFCAVGESLASAASSASTSSDSSLKKQNTVKGYLHGM